MPDAAILAEGSQPFAREMPMRAVQIIYFIILFAILGSYLVFAIPSNALRLHVAAAESLAPDQQNMVAVWARNLDNG